MIIQTFSCVFNVFGLLNTNVHFSMTTLLKIGVMSSNTRRRDCYNGPHQTQIKLRYSLVLSLYCFV